MWRLMHRGCNHTLDAPLVTSPNASHMQRRHYPKSNQGTHYREHYLHVADCGKTYDFNTADRLNDLLIKALLASRELKEGCLYDLDFDHQFIETEKYDAKPAYKKFTGYRPGVAVIGDMIVGIENSDGNTNVRFHQEDSLKRFFEKLLNRQS